MTNNFYEVNKVLSISVTKYILIPEEAMTNSESSLDSRNVACLEHKHTSCTAGATGAI
jgi:hypothetical protein